LGHLPVKDNLQLLSPLITIKLHYTQMCHFIFHWLHTTKTLTRANLPCFSVNLY